MTADLQAHHNDKMVASSASKDLVCGMKVDPHTAKHRTVHGGQTYYFCSARCREKFEADPAKHAAPAPTSVAHVPEGTIYTCPMHPEIRQVGPGGCLICGMAPEPVMAGNETGPSPELANMTRRFWIGLVLSLPLVTIETGTHVFNVHFLDPQLANRIELLLATPVVFWGGWPFFERAGKSLVTRNLNMFTLIALGTGIAWVYSIVGTASPQLFPGGHHG